MMARSDSMVVHCFFEQSGTFKNEFRKLGITAYDYDIRNDFNETDFQFDLFAHIRREDFGDESCFDSISDGDMIFAFFPCIRFSKLWVWHCTSQASQYQKKTDIWKCDNFIKSFAEMAEFACLVIQLVKICLKRNIKLVIENPYDPQHLLTRYWPFIPKVIHRNRRLDGDWYEQPTQYYFFGFEPYDNVIMDEPIVNYSKRVVDGQTQVDKSLISPEYARRFIRRYLLP